jgi:glucokinase
LIVTARRLLGLDLGGTNVKTVVLEEDGGSFRRVTSSTAPARADAGPDAVVERLVEIGRGAIHAYGPIGSAGIGLPGLFDRASGEVLLFPNLPGPWRGHPLREPVASGLGVPVTLINDARAFTLAEGRLGAGRGCRLLACLVLGTGVGGGVLVDGEVELGAWGVAGEIGHQTVVPDGPRCGCGNRGCVEAVAKAGALAELAGRATAEDVFEGVRTGDERCRDAVETVAGYLGIAIANVVAVLGPRRIVIGGGIASAGELLLGPIRDAVRRRVTLVPPDEIEVVAAVLGEYAGAIGAALAAAAQVPVRDR